MRRTWSRKPWPEAWTTAPTGRVLRALFVLPMSDRVSNGFVGWAVRASKIKWIFAFPLLLGGVAVCAALQTAAFVVALLLFSVVALYLGIGNFGFYSDKRIALRCAVG